MKARLNINRSKRIIEETCASIEKMPPEIARTVASQFALYLQRKAEKLLKERKRSSK